MIRALFFLALIALAALCLGWVADQPGDVSIVFGARQYQTKPVIALVAVLAFAFAIALLLGIAAYFLRLPSRWRAMARERSRRNGLAALSRGMVAAGAGDLRQARRATAEATRHMPNQPLTLLLEAQTALLAGDREATEKTFQRIAEHPETRVLGLRGLHMEAQRRGDVEAAHGLAAEAQRIAPLPWASQAVLDHHAGQQDWRKALAAVDANLSQRTIDKPAANRQRAVLKTAIALELERTEPDQSLRFANEAVSLAPDLTPAAVLAGRLLGRRGDIRKASRMLEAAWRLGPRPDIAATYLDLRPGDSSADRLKRARSLAALAPSDPESLMTVAEAAITARDFPLARESMAPLVSGDSASSPSVRMCRIMASLSEADSGSMGAVREWLARASRAPRDRAWMADGVVSDTWSPVSPVTGKLDAWVWQTPPERLSEVWDPRADPIPDSPPEAENPAPLLPPSLGAPEAPAANPETTETRSSPGLSATALATAPDDPGPRRG